MRLYRPISVYGSKDLNKTTPQMEVAYDCTCIVADLGDTYIFADIVFGSPASSSAALLAAWSLASRATTERSSIQFLQPALHQICKAKHYCRINFQQRGEFWVEAVQSEAAFIYIPSKASHIYKCRGGWRYQPSMKNGGILRGHW